MTYPKYIRKPDFIGTKNTLLPTTRDSTGECVTTITINLNPNEYIIFKDTPVMKLYKELDDVKRAMDILIKRKEQIAEEIEEAWSNCPQIPPPNTPVSESESECDTPKLLDIQTKCSKPY